MDTMEFLIFLVFAGVPVVGLIGFLLGYVWQDKNFSKIFLAARFGSWSVANLSSVLAVLVIFVLISIFPAENYVNSTGYATTLAMFLTLLLAFNKFGFHEVVQMSREAAWRIHYTFGTMTLVFGVVHTVLVFWKLGLHGVLKNETAVIGSVSLLFMLAGVIPAKFFIHDHFKLLHFKSFIGILFTVFNTLAVAYRKRSFLTIFTAVAVCLLVLAYLAQKLIVRAGSYKATVQECQVVSEKQGAHIFLQLSAPGFSFKPGQWTKLSVPSISTVPHPFTAIPMEGPDANLAIFMKVSGAFTQSLAAQLTSNQKISMSLQGPFGCPRFVGPMAFVVGGVGVTPALSLIKSCSGSHMFWALRSEALVQQARPWLPHVGTLSCVKVNGELVHGQDAESLSSWLKTVMEQHGSEGQKSGTVFVCGPARMSEEARRAVKVSGMSWHVHTEEFRFLPKALQPKERPCGVCTEKAWASTFQQV